VDTCAFFDDGHASLVSAQENKVNLTASRLAISSDHRVLDEQRREAGAVPSPAGDEGVDWFLKSVLGSIDNILRILPRITQIPQIREQAKG